MPAKHFARRLARRVSPAARTVVITTVRGGVTLASRAERAQGKFSFVSLPGRGHSSWLEDKLRHITFTQCSSPVRGALALTGFGSLRHRAAK